MSMDTCVYIGDELARYGFGQGHPFGPDRLGAFWKQAQASGLAARPVGYGANGVPNPPHIECGTA